MTKQKIDFIKRADRFRVFMDGQNYAFTQWSEAAKFYNENVRTAQKIELDAICGMVGMTVFYHYN